MIVALGGGLLNSWSDPCRTYLTPYSYQFIFLSSHLFGIQYKFTTGISVYWRFCTLFSLQCNSEG